MPGLFLQNYSKKRASLYPAWHFRDLSFYLFLFIISCLSSPKCWRCVTICAPVRTAMAETSALNSCTVLSVYSYLVNSLLIAKLLDHYKISFPKSSSFYFTGSKLARDLPTSFWSGFTLLFWLTLKRSVNISECLNPLVCQWHNMKYLVTFLSLDYW